MDQKNTVQDVAHEVFPVVTSNKRPVLGCLCTVIIRCDTPLGLSFKYQLNSEFTVVVGESDDEQDDSIENLLLTMFNKQTKLIQVTLSESGKAICQIRGDGIEDEPSAIVAELILTEVENKPPVCFWPLEEKFETALHHKTVGVTLFQEGNTSRAFRRFGLALKFLILMHPQKTLPAELREKYIQLRVQCYSNMAACQLQLGAHQYVIDNCTKALDLDSGNTKCIYRRAEAYYGLEKFDLCMSDIQKGLKLEPKSKSFITLLQKLSHKNMSSEVHN